MRRREKRGIERWWARYELSRAHVDTRLPVENFHALITNVIKRYNWIAYQPVEFTDCNVAGTLYANSDPLFSRA
jgi:hypothetical protein